MSRESDIGLAYLESLHICPARDTKEFHAKVSDALGKAVYEQFTKVSGEVASVPGSGKNSAYYAFKNQNEYLNHTISGLWDGDIYRAIVNWLFEHREYFGRDILDIGCDNGILSCFIAKMLPKSQITGIDKCWKAMKVARKTAVCLGLANVKFFTAEAGRYDPSALFDTVISIRTVHENFAVRHSVFPASHCNAVDEASGQLTPYARCMAGHVAPAGNLITIERFDLETNKSGWLRALYEERFSPDSKGCEKITVQEVGVYSTLDACAFVRRGAGQPSQSRLWSGMRGDPLRV